ncbi:MAG: protein kinase [Candidatus Berkiella sp.]
MPLFHRKEEWKITPAQWKKAIAYFAAHPTQIKMDRKADPNDEFSFVRVEGKIYALSNVRYLQKFGGNYGWVKPSIEQPDNLDDPSEKTKYVAIKIEGQNVRGPDNPEAIAAKRAGLMKGEAARPLDPNKYYKDEKYTDKEFKLYTVLEWLEGEDLDKAVASRQLNETQLYSVALEAAKELARLHKMGIVHCDLKGANFRLLLDENNNPTSVRAMDFGFSKIIPDGENKVWSQFQDGSPGYKAPEIRNNLYYPATDTYALAVILLTEINIAGQMSPSLKAAFTQKLIEAEKRNIDVIAFLEAMNFTIEPPAIKQMLEGMLERDPERRLALQQVIDTISSRLGQTKKVRALPPTPSAKPQDLPPPPPLPPRTQLPKPQDLPPPPSLPSFSKRAKAVLPHKLPPAPVTQAKTIKEKFKDINAEFKQKLEKDGKKGGPSNKGG